jgi:Tol biopolymer transport system component
MLAFVGGRKGNNDIYVISVAGGTEVRLTTTPGKDDGPDYSADGRSIYFNSYQAGHMQIWRMDADGSHPVQLTSDAYSNWFPHPSPDGKWIVFLSFLEDQADSHPANKNVMLRLMPAAGGEPRTLAKFMGGQGTINVPSWAPDSKRFAFVSYPPVNAAEH